MGRLVVAIAWAFSHASLIAMDEAVVVDIKKDLALAQKQLREIRVKMAFLKKNVNQAAVVAQKKHCCTERPCVP